MTRGKFLASLGALIIAPFLPVQRIGHKWKTGWMNMPVTSEKRLDHIEFWADNDWSHHSKECRHLDDRWHCANDCPDLMRQYQEVSAMYDRWATEIKRAYL